MAHKNVYQQSELSDAALRHSNQEQEPGLCLGVPLGLRLELEGARSATCNAGELRGCAASRWLPLRDQASFAISPQPCPEEGYGFLSCVGRQLLGWGESSG